MWYEIIPSAMGMFVGFAIIETLPNFMRWLSWGTPVMKRPTLDLNTYQFIRRDQRLADTVLNMRYPANHHYTIGLDGIPDDYPIPEDDYKPKTQ